MSSLKILGFVLASAAISEAAVVTWQGGAGNWNTDNKWTVGANADQYYKTNAVSATLNGDFVHIAVGSGLTLSRTGNLVLRSGAQLNVTSGTVAITGKLGDQANTASGQIMIANDAKLTASNGIAFDKNGVHFIMTNGAHVVTSVIQLETTGSSSLTFAGGILELTGDNPITGSSFPSLNVNITANAGDFSILATGTPLAGKSLATKVGSDLFAIDGTKIIVDASGASVSELNDELATKVVNGKWLQVSGADDGPQTLEVIPEPTVIGLISIAGCGFLVIRRLVAN